MLSKADLLPAVKIIQEKTSIVPKFGIVLGSGLAPLADQIEDAVHISYDELPGIPPITVHGHFGELVIGKLGGTPVACLKGRIHYYEGATNRDFKALIRILKLIGCENLIVTNSSGSLRKEVGPGELVLINDHINMQFRNPLIGKNDEDFGPRFFPMDDLYDKELREKFHATGKSLGIKTHEGVYCSVLGPNFETPAEIKAFRLLGAEVIGMSTVPDVLVARHCGLRICIIATITNFSADINDESITHNTTLTQGKLASGKLCKLVESFLEQHGSEF